MFLIANSTKTAPTSMNLDAFLVSERLSHPKLRY